MPVSSHCACSRSKCQWDIVLPLHSCVRHVTKRAMRDVYSTPEALQVGEIQTVPTDRNRYPQRSDLTDVIWLQTHTTAESLNCCNRSCKPLSHTTFKNTFSHNDRSSAVSRLNCHSRQHAVTIVPYCYSLTLGATSYYCDQYLRWFCECCGTMAFGGFPCKSLYYLLVIHLGLGRIIFLSLC